MKALTIRQPYAQAVAWGEKTVEWRSWSTTHRGPLLICAGAAWADGDYNIPEESLDMFPMGVALCVVDVLDVVPFTEAHVEGAVLEEVPTPAGYAWLLGPPREVQSFPVRGKPGLFEISGV